MPNYFAHPTADIAADALIGDETKIWHNVHIRENVIIGKGCVLGKGVYIDRNVILGDRVRIQNGVSVYQGVTLEDDVFVGPNATFTNDMFPRANSSNWKIVPTILRKGSSVGANATILCGVEIGKYGLVGAGSVVTGNVLPYSLVVGSPARLKGFVCVCGKLLQTKPQDTDDLLLECPDCSKTLSINFTLK